MCSGNVIVQFIRFLIVGAGTFGIDFSLLVFLTSYCGINYLFSATAGFLAGSVANYFISIRWVFSQGKYKRKTIEFSVFILFTVLGLALNNAIMYAGHGVLTYDYRIVKFVSLAVVTLFNFATKKCIVFAR